jgi:predicted ester cyclase
MGTTDRITSIAERVCRRAAGDRGAAADIWADEIVTWRNGSPNELTVSSALREDRLELERNTLRRALPDLTVSSKVHVDEAAGVVIELTTMEGHSIDVPGSAVAGDHHRFTACYVYFVNGDRIVRVDTYDDASTARRWNELMTHTKLLDLLS